MKASASALFAEIALGLGFAYDYAMSYYQSTRYFFGGPVTKSVKAIIAVTIGAFIIQWLVELAAGSDRMLTQFFGLVPVEVTHSLRFWQFATYMFLHGGVFHIFFNMLTLFMFGNDLERYWGTPRFLKYYFITGIGAGLCSWAVAMNSRSPIIGASGAIYGLLLAYGLLYPNRIVYLNFFIPVKVKWLVLIMGAMSFYSSITGGEPGVAHIAHLGGMLVGFVYLKGRSWIGRYHVQREQRRREQLKRQFEIYYGDVRRKIEKDKDKGPTIH